MGERRARQLIAVLAGIRAGIAAAISRHALIERMEATASSGVYQHLRLHAFGPYIGHEFATLLRSYRVGYSRGATPTGWYYLLDEQPGRGRRGRASAVDILDAAQALRDNNVLGQTVESFLDSGDGGRDGAFTGNWKQTR